jgi:aldo/keto reductase family protein
VVKAGKARYLGASSMQARRFAKLQHVAERNGWMKFISMQDQYNLIDRGEELEMFGLLADQGVGSIPWSPLAQGVVTRPWGDRTTNRGATGTDRFGRPLWLDTDRCAGGLCDGKIRCWVRPSEWRGWAEPLPLARYALPVSPADRQGSSR